MQNDRKISQKSKTKTEPCGSVENLFIKILEITVIVYFNMTFGEKMLIKLCTVVVGHRCHVVNDYLVRLGFNIRHRCGIMVS